MPRSSDMTSTYGDIWRYFFDIPSSLVRMPTSWQLAVTRRQYRLCVTLALSCYHTDEISVRYCGDLKLVATRSNSCYFAFKIHCSHTLPICTRYFLEPDMPSNEDKARHLFDYIRYQTISVREQTITVRVRRNLYDIYTKLSRNALDNCSRYNDITTIYDDNRR